MRDFCVVLLSHFIHFHSCIHFVFAYPQCYLNFVCLCYVCHELFFLHKALCSSLKYHFLFFLGKMLAHFHEKMHVPSCVMIVL